MIIPLKQYAELHGINRNTLLRKLERGEFKTGRQVGRAWLVDSDEKPKFKIPPKTPLNPKADTVLTAIPDGYVGVSDYAKLGGYAYNVVSRKATYGLFKSLITVAGKRYLDPKEPLPTSRRVKSGKYIGIKHSKNKPKKKDETIQSKKGE